MLASKQTVGISHNLLANTDQVKLTCVGVRFCKKCSDALFECPHIADSDGCASFKSIDFQNPAVRSLDFIFLRDAKFATTGS